MNDEEFDLFVEESVAELDRKQKSLTKSHGLGNWEDYSYDAPSGKLQFKDKKGEVQVVADTLLLGSYSTTGETWQWSWANKSLPADIRKKAEVLKKLHKVTGMDSFKQPTLEIDEGMVWQLAAMCISHLDAQGCYHMTAGAEGQLQVFVALMNIEKAKGK